MNLQTRTRAGATAMITVCISLCLGNVSMGHTHNLLAIRSAIQKEAVVATHASGTFAVKLTPQASGEKTEDAGIGRMTSEKQWHGDFEGTSKGQMLTAGTEVKGSAGYVAMEKVSGTLHGRTGSFVLQHSGTMTRGTPHLVITVVPDSGTGELAGLAGTLTIKIAEGKHSYEFEYTLAKTN